MTRGLLSLMASRERESLFHSVQLTASLTLSSHENERHLADISIVIHLRVILIDSLETLLVLQTEHEDNSIDPMCELEGEEEDKREVFRCPLNGVT